MRSRLFTCLITNLILLCLTITASAQLRPDATALNSTALKFIPAKASFCSIMLRNREQFDRLANSKAIAKLMENPLVQQGLGELRREWENPTDDEFAQFKDFIEENEDLVETIIDGVSHEVFLYGGDGYGKVLKLFNEFNNKMNAAQFEAIGQGDFSGEAPTKFIAEWLEENLDELNAVDTLIGMKLTDTNRAEDQLERLEELLQDLADEEELIKEALKRRKIAGSEFITLAFNGKMIPWEELELDEADIDEKRLERIKEKIEEKSAMIAVGIHNGYLLMAIGKDDSVITNLGQGPLLIDHEKMAPVRAAADKRLTQVGYASDTFVKQATATNQQLQQLKTMGDGVLAMAPIDEDMALQIKADINELVSDLEKAIPEPGAMIGYQFMTPNGYEGYRYNWAQNLHSDGSKPLTILEHVGGDPILFAAGRTKYNPEGYATLVKWVKKAYGYTEEFVLPELDDVQRDMAEDAMERFSPIFTRLDKVNRDMVLPAFADGQSALIVDAKQTSTQWQSFMPATDTPLPMLEIAIACGVSDRNLLMKGYTEYFSIAQDILNHLNEMEPNQIPPVQIPDAETKETKNGVIYYYRLPAMAGLDKAVAPNTGISDNLFVMSMMPKMTQRLLEPAELQYQEGGPLKKMSQPLASAWQLNFADLMTAVEPWVEYAADNSGEDDAEQKLDMAIQILDVLRCFKSASGVAYTEDGATVAHFETRFEDLD